MKVGIYSATTLPVPVLLAAALADVCLSVATAVFVVVIFYY